MRSRTKSDETRGQQREGHEERQKEQPKDAERSRGVRVPKIQYRFIKELEEKRPSPNDLQAANDMVTKIRRYPLEAAHVMSSWERYTKTAIEDYKAGKGSNDARDQQHRAYALLFSALRDRPAATDQRDLKGRLDHVARRDNDERSITEDLAPRPGPPTSAPAKAREEPETREAMQGERGPTQRTLALPEQTFGPERTSLDNRVDKMIGKLREIPSELRSTIEVSARDLIAEGHHTPKSAREALPRALMELKDDRNPENTVYALTLATIARAPDHASLLTELRNKSVEEHGEITAQARMRLERYPPLESGISLVKRDQIGAAIHDVLSPTAESRKEALVLAQARQEVEALADPKRLSWERIAADMVSEPG